MKIDIVIQQAFERVKPGRNQEVGAENNIKSR